MLRPTAVAACLLPLTLSAQTPTPPPKPPASPPAKDEPKPLEKIEVQGDGLAERRESTASKLIINRDEITKYGDTNVLDVLKRLPGVTVDSGPGGRGGAVRMRGLGTGYTQILVNGERMPPGFTLDSISPDLIDRIEIVRGATAEFSTAQAIAGTINVVLRRPLSTQRSEVKVGASVQHDRPNVNASAQFSGGSGPFTWTVPINGVRFAFVAEGRNEQSFYEPDGELSQFFHSRRRNEGFGGNINVAPRLSWNLGKGHTLNLDAFALTNVFRGHFIEDNRPVIGPPPPYTSTDLRLKNENQTFRTNAHWVRRWDDGARIDARFGVTAASFDSASEFVAKDIGAATRLERTVDSKIDDRGVTSNGKYTFPVVKGHNWVTGWDGAWNERDDERLQQDVFTGTGRVTRLDEVFDTSIRRLAVFGQDEWDVTERFAVYLGVRWEGIETRSVGNLYDAIRNRSSVVSPIVNMLWKLPGTQKDQVRLGISRTYKPPGIGELVPRRFFAPNNSPVTPDFIGNPDLKPELSWGLDAAYEHYPAGGGNISISAYHRRVEDIVQRATVFEDGLYISRPFNIGTGKVSGIELDAKGKLTQVWKEAPNVDLRANFAVNRSEVDYLPGPHNRLNEQVPWNGTFGFDYRVNPKLTVGSSFTARAGGTVRLSDRQIAYASVNRNLEAYVLYRFTPALQLRVTLQNILAQDALLLSRFTDATGTSERSNIDLGFVRYGFLLEYKL